LLEWAIELQSIAQGGLYYCKDKFDIERFERIREISAEMISLQSDIPLEKVKDLFCNEIGYQTPKLDTRAAIFKNNKILLVQESNGTWSLPGGWVDVDLSIKENTIKEVKEEAGLNVTADMIIAVQDREKHNLPVYAYKVCKVFVLCSLIDGEFKKNIETIKSDYFSLDNVPLLATEKNNKEQIKMCFEAYQSTNWKTLFD
ncbi:NUDIX hydrolase, partial [Clostridium sp.]